MAAVLPRSPEEASPDKCAERARAAEARVGSLLRDKWRLDSLLGIGGIAAVYAATHRNGMRGAVKLLHGDYGPETPTRKLVERRFLREGYLANKVDHRGVVRVLDDDLAEDGHPFLVMELLEGEALDQWAQGAGGRLSVREVMSLASQLLDVLAAAHDRGIVHRDLKPENLFLTMDGDLKVLDFGLAGFFEGLEAGLLTNLHATTSVMGTPAFMSPEQACGRLHLVDAQSDLWAVGATMFTLLTGEIVHAEAKTGVEIMAAAFGRPARSLAEAMPDAPPSLVAVVDRALQREKAERWLDARAMRAALAEAFRGLYGVSLPPPPGSPGRTSVPSGRPSGALLSFTGAPSARPPPSPSDAPAAAMPAMGSPTRAAWDRLPRGVQAALLMSAGIVAGAAGVFATSASRSGPTNVTRASALAGGLVPRELPRARAVEGDAGSSRAP